MSEPHKINTTVADIIKVLQKMRQDVPVFVRPKYYGNVECWEDVPVNVNGISSMVDKDGRYNVTFLV